MVAGARPDPVRQALGDRPVRVVSQERPEGTGAALLVARPELDVAPGPVLVLHGDGPLVDTALLDQLASPSAAGREPSADQLGVEAATSSHRSAQAIGDERQEIVCDGDRCRLDG